MHAWPRPVQEGGGYLQAPCPFRYALPSCPSLQAALPPRATARFSRAKA